MYGYLQFDPLMIDEFITISSPKFIALYKPKKIINSSSESIDLSQEGLEPIFFNVYELRIKLQY